MNLEVSSTSMGQPWPVISHPPEQRRYPWKTELVVRAESWLYRHDDDDIGSGPRELTIRELRSDPRVLSRIPCTPNCRGLGLCGGSATDTDAIRHIRAGQDLSRISESGFTSSYSRSWTGAQRQIFKSDKSHSYLCHGIDPIHRSRGLEKRAGKPWHPPTVLT